MSVNVQPRFRNGDKVYFLLANSDGTEGYYEAIILDQKYDDFFTHTDYYTLAAHVRGTDHRPTWTVFDDIPRAKLEPERRYPRPQADGVERGALCHYVITNWWGREEPTDAVVLDHRLVESFGGKEKSVYIIARRAVCPAGWEIAKDVDGEFVSFGAYVRGPRFIIE